MELKEIVRKARELFLKCGIPVYDDVGNELKAVSLVLRYAYYNYKDTSAILN